MKWLFALLLAAGISGIHPATADSWYASEGPQEPVERIAWLEAQLEGRDEELSLLNRQIAELSELLALEQEATLEMRTTVSQLSASLQESMRARDKLEKMVGYVDQMSASIACGERMVTIPVILDGKHIMSVAIRKSSIISLSHMNREIEGELPASNRGAILNLVTVQKKERISGPFGGGEELLFTNLQNYAPLLECLDEGFEPSFIGKVLEPLVSPLVQE